MSPWSILLVLLGALQIANALWMLIAPESWYAVLPAGVPDTGPLNVHFVRDIGCAFLATGFALVWAAATSKVAVRFACIGVASVFAVGHGVVHLLDLSQGALGPRHWMLDLPSVFVPALLLLALTLHSAREAARPERRSP